MREDEESVPAPSGEDAGGIALLRRPKSMEGLGERGARIARCADFRRCRLMICRDRDQVTHDRGMELLYLGTKIVA